MSYFVAGMLRPTDAVPVLIEIAGKDSQWPIGSNAANTLGRIGDVRAILILQKLADTDPYVNDFDKPGQLFRRGRL
jgi:HEAT repeat protein